MLDSLMYEREYINAVVAETAKMASVTIVIRSETRGKEDTQSPHR